MERPDLKPCAAGTRLRLRVQPRARRTELVSVEAGLLKVRLKAPPVDGAANKELLRWLGKKVFRVPPTSLRVVRGHSSREKTVEIPGLTPDQCWAKISPLLP